MKNKIDDKKQGKKNRSSGADFERRVRADLISKGWIVDKWTNNINDNECKPAKTNRFNMRSCGFPDFIAFKRIKMLYIDGKDHFLEYNPSNLNEIHFIECKVGKYLDKEEKAKAQWYLKNNYCSKFFVAFKTKLNNRVIVNYKEVILDV